MANNTPKWSQSILSKMSDIKSKFSLQVAWTALAASLILTWCLNKQSEKNFASNNDIESKLTTLLKDYSEKKWYSFDSKLVSSNEISRMENLAKEISFSLSSIPNLDKKAIFIDIDWATWVVVNETLKKLSYNTTLNYYINWSDDKFEKEVINYDRLFSLVSKYRLTKEDQHFIEDNNWTIKSNPWAIMLDYNRVPDNSQIENYYTSSENTLYNLYQLTENDLPNQDIFLDKEDQIREWVVLVTYKEWINQDIKEYLYKLASNWIEVKIITIDWDHVVWLDNDKFAEYNTKITEFLSSWLLSYNQESNASHHSWTAVVPYYLYWGGSYNNYGWLSTNYIPVTSSTTNSWNKVTLRDFYTRWTAAFSWLNNNFSKLSSSISSSRISWAKWWMS